ncbi:hypothetical protein ACTA71_010001 [Dictyostelium dimigraforme]
MSWNDHFITSRGRSNNAILSKCYNPNSKYPPVLQPKIPSSAPPSVAIQFPKLSKQFASNRSTVRFNLNRIGKIQNENRPRNCMELHTYQNQQTNKKSLPQRDKKIKLTSKRKPRKVQQELELTSHDLQITLPDHLQEYQTLASFFLTRV